jgi:hypothetical protein
MVGIAFGSAQTAGYRHAADGAQVIHWFVNRFAVHTPRSFSTTTVLPE